MMVDHNDVDPARGELGDLDNRGCAAVDRDEQIWPVFVDATLDTLAAQAVTLFQSRRQKQSGRITVAAEKLEEKRERCHAVDVVITEKHDAMFCIDCGEKPFHRHVHVRKKKRVGQGTKPRPEEALYLSRVRKTFAL